MFSIIGTICIGDKTSCGGTVATGSPLSDVGGRPIARKGDKVACRYNCVIVEGNETEIIDGAPMALHGARTSRGCSCLSQNNDRHGDGTTEAQRAAIPMAADAGLAFIPEIAELLNENQWIEFRLIDASGAPIPNEPYVLTEPGGETISGNLDANGHARVEPVRPGNCSVHFPGLDYTMTVTT